MTKEKSFVRSMFKATKIDVLKKEVQQEDETMYTGDGNNYIKLSEGVNKIRIFPKHPEDKKFYARKVVNWLPFIGDDSKEHRRPILNPIFHGKIKRSILNEYITFLRKKIESLSAKDSAEVSKLMKGKESILDSFSWEVYCWKIKKNSDGEVEKEFGLLGFSKTVRDGLNDCSIIEDEEEAIELDPFTDPDDGQIALITKDSVAGKKNAKDYYTVQLGKGKYPILDDELMEFLSRPSFKTMYENVYDVSDFEKTLESIELIDSKYGLEILEDDGFISILEEISSLYRVEDKPKKGKAVEEDDEEEEPVKKVKKAVKKEEPEEEEDEEEVVAPPKKKKVVEEPEEEEEEEVVVPSKKKKVVEEPEEEEDEEEPVKKKTEGKSREERLAELKARLGK